MFENVSWQRKLGVLIAIVLVVVWIAMRQGLIDTFIPASSTTAIVYVEVNPQGVISGPGRIPATRESDGTDSARVTGYGRAYLGFSRPIYKITGSAAVPSVSSPTPPTFIRMPKLPGFFFYPADVFPRRSTIYFEYASLPAQTRANIDRVYQLGTRAQDNWRECMNGCFGDEYLTRSACVKDCNDAVKKQFMEIVATHPWGVFHVPAPPTPAPPSRRVSRRR